MDRDDGASLLMAFRGLQIESVKQGEAHLDIANDLENLVHPFESWAEQHAARVANSKALLLDGFLKTYEEAVSDVCNQAERALGDVYSFIWISLISGKQTEGELPR